MRIAETKAALLERMIALLANPGTLPKVPYPYQLETITKFRDWLAAGGKQRRCHFEHATGLGKTIIFSSIIHACVGLRTLVIVPRRVLVEQIGRTLAEYTGGMIGHLSSLTTITNAIGEAVVVRGHDNHDTVITTDASFLRYADVLVREFDPHLIIRDECHNGYTKEEQDALERFRSAVILACSATPDFLTTVRHLAYEEVTLENGRVLYGDPTQFARTHFGPCIDVRSARWGIEEGWLAPLAWGFIDFDIALDGVGTTETEAGQDYNRKQLASLMRKHWSVMCDTIAGLYESGEYDLRNRQAFAVCGTVREAEELAERIRKLGIPAACITGNTTPKKRDAILRAYADRRIQLLTSVLVLREGWDAPGAEVCMMLRPTKSRVLYMQVMGRVLRRLPDGSFKVALVLDAHFESTAFNPLCAPALFKAPGEQVTRGGILIGPRKPWEGGGSTVPSPYLPKNATPRIDVVPALDIEYWSGKDGTFAADGEIWVTRHRASRMIGVHPKTILLHLPRTVQTRQGRDVSGKPATFYPLSVITAACANLLVNLPKAGDDGTFEADGETWGTIWAFAILLDISHASISSRLGAEIATKRGKDRLQKSATFYPLSLVKAACADLIENLPQAGDDGTFEADGETWGGSRVFSAKLGIAYQTIKSRCAEIVIRKGRMRNGVRGDFYPLSVVKSACADLLDGTPSASPNRLIADGQGGTWGTIGTIGKLLHLSARLIHPLLPVDIVTRELRDKHGRRFTSYPLSVVKVACADLLENLPQAGKDGTFEADGETWAHLDAAARHMGLRPGSVRERITKETPLRDGRDQLSRPATFYPLSLVKAACADLLENLPQAGDDGTFEADGETWETMRSCASQHSIAWGTMKLLIQRSGLKGRKGRTRLGRVRMFYSAREIARLVSGWTNG